MLYSLPGFISTYWMYIAGVAVICGILAYISDKFRGLLKKVVIVGVIVMALIAGYEYFTGDSLMNLPGSVEREMSKSPEHPETGRRYYKSYEERFGEKPPAD